MSEKYSFDNLSAGYERIMSSKSKFRVFIHVAGRNIFPKIELVIAKLPGRFGDKVPTIPSLEPIPGTSTPSYS